MRRARRGFTALEVMIAAILISMLLGGVMAVMGTGSRGMITSAAHAAARDDALRVLRRLERDLDRVVVGDLFDSTSFPSVVEPVRLEPGEDGVELTFYAYHHRRFYSEERRIALVGQRLRYRVHARESGGVDLYRNDQKVNREPLQEVRIEPLSATEAGKLGLSPTHALTVSLLPRLPGDVTDGRARLHAQSRIFHLDNIESQYACLMSLKRAGAPYPVLSQVPDPPRRSEVFGQYKLDQVPLDWLRPLGLVELDKTLDFDDATENAHEQI